MGNEQYTIQRRNIVDNDEMCADLVDAATLMQNPLNVVVNLNVPTL